MANNWGAPNNTMVAFINDDSVALNYPVSPGFTVALINANDPAKSKLFLKSAQANGMPNPMRIFEMKDVTPQPQGGDMVSRQELDRVNQELAEMKAMVAEVLKGGNKQ